MKKILFFGFYLLLFFDVHSQKITGTVYDKLTKITIRGATVFLNGSVIGDRTDLHGDFQVMLPEKQKLPIVATYPGHETLLLLEYPANAHIHFFLDLRVYAISNSLNSKEDRERRRVNLDIFREQFLGKSANAASCRIHNEGDLILKYDPRRTLLTVRCGNPLVIDNKALGYRIIYYLTKFEYSVSSEALSFTGCYYFEEPGIRGEKLAITEKKRQLAYFGSQMEFFRALWHNTLDSAGYDLRNSSNKILTYDSLVYERSGLKYWKYKNPVTIYHFSKNKSTIMQTADTVYFDKLGYCDTQGVTWQKSGEMTLQRLGDLLPFDYPAEP